MVIRYIHSGNAYGYCISIMNSMSEALNCITAVVVALAVGYILNW